MPGSTTNYSWNLPTVGGDEDAWGGYLNSNWSDLDTLLGGTNATEFAILDGATVTTAELNLLDGVTWTLTDFNGLTSTVAELNILDGATVTVAEVNILDGDTAATATTLVDADRLVANDDGTMVQIAMTDVRSYLLIDEDDMASDSATKLPTQQSVKAYVDTQVGIVNIVTKTASASASLEFTELDATLYRGYKFEIFGLLPGTDGHDLNVQFSTDGGSTWITTSDYEWAITGNRTNGSYFDIRNNNDICIEIGSGVGAAAGEPGLSASLTLYEPDASAYTILGGTGFFRQSDNDRCNAVMHGFLDGTSAVNAVRFIAQSDASGTLASGTITMQGITR